MMTIEQARQDFEKAQKRLSLLQQLAELEGNESVRTVQPAQKKVAAPPVPGAPRRGRPPGSKNKKNLDGNKDEAIVVVGNQVEKSPTQNLPALLTSIAEAAAGPLKVADFVQAARDRGYVTESTNFTNMVYQALLKLCKKSVLKKDEEKRDYLFVGKAA